jgi:hypothetical protein
MAQLFVAPGRRPENLGAAVRLDGCQTLNRIFRTNLPSLIRRSLFLAPVGTPAVAVVTAAW